MAGTNPITFAADQILQASTGPIYHYQAAVAASAGMSGAAGALPTHEEAFMAQPTPQGAPVTEMVQQPLGAPVTTLQPQEAEAMMGPPMTMTQLLQAVEMIARLPLPIAPPPVGPNYGLCSIPLC
jgi:hypothetical protein